MLFNKRNIITPIECCGCSACYNICPKNAISMKENSEGFLYPFIDEEKCVDCGLCKKVCPIVNKKNENFKQSDCYAAMADDEIRKVSSSGGAFSILANYILSQNGYICGCTFDTDELRAKHIIINSKSDLSKLRGSKYVQSDIGDIYKEIKKLLESSNFVLFCGTPCQVSGLNSFLNKNYEKLLTVDILCHGVPSPKVYKKYLKELLHYDDEKVVCVNFRDKVRGWSPTLTNTTTTTTTTYSFVQVDDSYMQLFLNNISLRENCTGCKFCSTQRVGDFTIADFWGIDNFDKNLNDGRGTSLVLVNNNKSRSLWNEVKNNFKQTQTVPLKYAILGNRNLYAPHRVHPKRKEFFENLDKYSLKQLVNMYLFDKYDCGIMNYWASWNYGAILTCYALQELVKKLGYTTKVINLRHKVWDSRKEYPCCQSKVDFVNKYFDLTKLCKTKKDLSNLNNNINTFIVGSDQVWNWGPTLQYLYFLDFVKNDKKKIACSASMIFEKFEQSDDVKTAIEYYMKQFDAVSVRELDSVDVCKKEFDTDAECILDPVFLLDKFQYEQLINNSKLENKNYIALYVLDNNKNIEETVSKLAEKYSCNIIRMNKNESIEDWLYTIKNARFVVTDSYHGTCFSIIFEKQFISFCNSRGNSRFRSLFSMLRMSDRLFSNISSLEDIFAAINTEVDYNVVNNILNKEASKSLNWLCDALALRKNKFQQSVESRLLNILIETKQIPCGLKPYLIRAKNKTFRIIKWIVRQIKTKLFMLSENTFFLK